MSDGREFKRADKIVPGDYLPYRYHKRGVYWLEVVKVEPKRTRVWITVVDPETDERMITRPAKDTRMAFKEVATIIDEAEVRMAKYRKKVRT